MKDILMDTLIDGVKLIPFLFVAFLIIELIEHKLSNKNKELISKTGRFGPLFGSILGVFPQCGFSVLTANLYVTRIVSLGTLISVYLSTSDEMLPILLSQNVDAVCSSAIISAPQFLQLYVTYTVLSFTSFLTAFGSSLTSSFLLFSSLLALLNFFNSSKVKLDLQ